ncbi:MAG: signal peptidase II [Bacillota bacterium]
MFKLFQYVKIIYGVETMYIALFSIIIIIIDQLSKYFIRVYLSQSQKLSIIGDYLYLTFVKNRGAAFGILRGQRSFFIIITIFFLIFIIYLYNKELPKNIMAKISVIFLLGGSIANLIDRIIFHYVTDFIAFDILAFYQLPVINIADIFIFFGVIILTYQLLFLTDRGA